MNISSSRGFGLDPCGTSEMVMFLGNMLVYKLDFNDILNLTRKANSSINYSFPPNNRGFLRISLEMN